MKTKLLLLALLTVGFAQSQNLIQNGSFESFTGTTPDSWTIPNSYGTSDKEITTFSNGASSLKAFPVSPGANILPIFWISQDFTLNDTQTYTLSFDYYIPGTSMTNYISRIGIGLDLNNSNDAYFFPTIPSIPVIYGQWKTVTMSFNILAFNAPATSTSLKLTLQAGLDINFSGSNVYFDNVSIVGPAGTLGTADFNKKSEPIAVVSKNEIKLNNEYKDSSYVIYSIDGKAVKRGKNNSSDIIEISDLKKGVYLLKLSDASSSVKFIKQ